MKIVVTGGKGFIGAATVKAANAAGHEVKIFDRANGHDIRMNSNVRRLIDDDVDHVIHLAGVLGTAELFDDPEHALDVNVYSTLRIIKRCVDVGAGYTSISMPPVFPSIYTATKMCADRLATAYHNAYGLKTSRVVAYNAYGVGQKHGRKHPQKIIPTFASKAWRNEPIPVWGDGEQTVDLIHVDDIAQVLVEATAFGDNDDVFDAGCGYPLTVNQVAEFVISVTGSKSHIQYLPMRVGELPTKIVALNPPKADFAGRDPRAAQYSQLLETINSYKPEQL